MHAECRAKPYLMTDLAARTGPFHPSQIDTAVKATAAGNPYSPCGNITAVDETMGGFGTGPVLRVSEMFIET